MPHSNHRKILRRVNHNNNHIGIGKKGSVICLSEPSENPASILDRRRGLVTSGLFLLCIFTYWNSLGCELVFDDITAIVENKDLRGHTPWRNLFANDFWGTPMSKEQSHKSYRPLTVITFRWNYFWGQTGPLGYHLVNVVLHGVVTLLFFKTCRQVVGLPAGLGLVASLLFALHPVSNGVAWCIAGSSS